MKKGLKMNYRRTLILSYLLLLALSVGVLLLETGSSLSRLEENTRQFSRMALS